MPEFITKYWIEFLFGLAIAGLSFLYRNLSKKIKKKMAEQEATKQGMLALLHNMLFAECNKYLSLGYIPLDKAEEILDNLKILYDAYHALGGNGTGTAIYNRIKELNIKKED